MNAMSIAEFSRKRQGIQALSMTVTPEIAMQWLEKNTKNRCLKPRQVDVLAKEIQEGRWCLNALPIIFAQTGELIDGQHRLHAVIKTGIPIETLVVFGVDDPDAFKTIDTNHLNRSTSQLLDIMGKKKNAIQLAAIAKRLLHWDNTVDKSKFSLTNDAWQRISQDSILIYADTHEKEILDMFQDMHLCLSYRRCGAGSAFITALIICNRTDDTTTYLLTEMIKSGANLPEKSAVTLLRDRFITPHKRSTLNWETDVMALTIKTWNYFSRNTPITFLRWRQEGPSAECFPIPMVVRKRKA